MLNVRLLLAIFHLIGTINVNGVLSEHTKGRLLTPEEGCGLAQVTAARIIGGSTARPGAWPWMAAIGYYMLRGNQFTCGGSLITSRHVLTAGHCTKKVHFVRLGGDDLTTSRGGSHIDVNVTHIEKHTKYRENSGTDLAILYLEHDVDFSIHVRPICLPIHEPIRSQGFVGTNPYIAGWGITLPNGEMSQHLKQVQVPVHNNALCEDIYLEAGVDFTDFSSRVVCAGKLTGGDGFCHGDSGGPLMLPIQHNDKSPFYQIGIASFAMNCAQKNSPGGFVSTQYHIDWIQRVLKVHSA